MRRLMTTATAAVLGAAMAVPLAAQKEKDLREIQDAIATMVEKDSGLVEWFRASYAHVVFPNVGKAGLGIGGAHGNGIMYRAGSPIGKAELKAVTVGFQLGGQSFVEVIFFKDKTAFDDFTRGNYEFGAQVSAVAITEGVSADLAYNGGVAVVTMAKGGLMYEATVSGQKFTYETFD